MRLARISALAVSASFVSWITLVACGSEHVQDPGDAASTADVDASVRTTPPAPGHDADATRDASDDVVTDAGPRFDAAPATLDPSFGDRGKVTIDFDGYEDEAHAIALGADGTIVVAGTGGGSPSHFAVARLRPDGALDPTFGQGGRVTTVFRRPNGVVGRSSADAVAIYPDGRILAAGRAHVNPNGALYVDTPDGGAANDDYTFVRYLPNGTLDATFGAGGIAMLSASILQEHIRGIVLAPDGKILASGVEQFIPELNKLVVMRLLDDGRLDTTFATNGIFIYTHPSEPGRNTDQLGHAIALSGASPSIVIGGALRPGGSSHHALAARLDTKGALDPTFGDGGITLARFESGSGFTYANAVRVGPDGSVYLGGTSGGGPVVIKTTPSGAIDTTFGAAGIARGSVAAKGVGYALVLAGGLPVLGSAAVNGTQVTPIVHRFLANGTPDPAFAGGAAVFPLPGVAGITALTTDGDHSLLAAGAFTQIPSSAKKSDMLVMRIGN